MFKTINKCINKIFETDQNNQKRNNSNYFSICRLFTRSINRTSDFIIACSQVSEVQAMNKNEEIRELMEKLLPLCTLADKNFLIGLLNGILWKQKKSNSDESTLEDES